MEATIPLQSNFQASAPEPSKRKSNSLLISISLFAILVLGALGLGIYSWAGTHPSATGATNLAYIHVVQAALLVLSLVAFGSIIAPLLRAQKNQVLTLEQKSKDLAEAGRQLDQTKTELERVNSQLSLSVFQLQNANVQFDIITSELDAAKREADAIFATVRQGLFLLGPDGTIGAQMSGELKAIFQTNELAKRNFAQLLRPLVPEKRHQTIADYVELLFDARKNDKQLQKFNPLKRVELNFASPEGGFQSKCVEFSFQRIINQKKVARVMVTALDITERVKLEDKLREGEVLREKQLELLFDLLQVDGTQLQTFLTEATAGVDKINAVFMEPGTGVAGQLQDKVQRVFRVAHNLKSQAAALGMHLFEKTIHQIEDQLNELRRCVSLANEDMLPVLVSISNFQAQIKDSTALIEKISGLRKSFGPKQEEQLGANIARPAVAQQPAVELVRSVEEICNKVSARTGKQARIEWKLSGLFDKLPSRQRRVLQDALLQLVRNAVVHGIESPADRGRASKPAFGCVTITLSRLPGEKRMLMLVRDDGAGLDADAIRSKAVREKLIPAEAELSENDLYALIFHPGFSTTDSATEDSGRGVGLDLVRAEVVEELNGEIQIAFSRGKFCEIGLIVPSE